MANCRNCGYELPEGSLYCPRCGTAVVKEEVPVAVAPAPSAPTAPVAPAPSGVTLALWWERILAWLIDVVIIGAILGIVGLFSFLGTQAITLIPGWPSWIPFLNFDLNGLVLFLYWLLMDGIYGQSFGKMIFRIKVTRLDGSRISMTDAVIESIGKAFLLAIDVLVGWILYPRRRQRLFNNLSGTIVVKVT